MEIDSAWFELVRVQVIKVISTRLQRGYFDIHKAAAVEYRERCQIRVC